MLVWEMNGMSLVVMERIIMRDDDDDGDDDDNEGANDDGVFDDVRYRDDDS